MKTWVLIKNGPAKQAFELQEQPIPSPKPNEVCIRAEGFGLNYADVMARMGLYQDCPPLPTVVGYEVTGIIHQVGNNVKHLKEGQRVTALTRFGGYAEYAVTDARAAVPIPDEMDGGAATALATQYATAYYCAEEMVQLHPGDHVLIQAAAGGVGTALVQLAKYKGCTVFGTAGSNEKLEYLKNQGVDYPINYNQKDFETEIKAVIGKRGLDVVFDSVGGTSVKKGRRLLGAGGRIVCYGAASMSGKKNIFKILKVVSGFGIIPLISLLMKSQAVIGVNMLRIADARPEVLQRCMENTVALYKKDVAKPVVGATFGYQQLPEAHELLASRKSVGKIYVHWKD